MNDRPIWPFKCFSRLCFYCTLLLASHVALTGQTGIGDTLKYTDAAPGTAMDIDYLESFIDSVAFYSIRNRAFPGMQVLVAHAGEVVFHKAYGYHTYDSTTTVKTDDIYDLASITKISSGLPVLMQLAGEGTFDIDATIADYVPEFKRSDKGDLVWREVLAHQARLMPWIPYWKESVRKNGKFKRRVFRDAPSKRFPIQVTDSLYLNRNYRKRIYRAIRKSPLNDTTGFVYSGLAYYIMPEMIERLTGEDFETYLKREIFEPIGAHTITYNPLRYYPRERIVPTERDTFFRMTQIHGKVHDEGAVMMDGVSCNAGLFATAYDLAKLGQLYLNRGSYGGQEILDPTVVDEFTRCQFCETGNHRGLGFDKPPWTVDPDAESLSICRSASPESFGHSGYTGTLIWADPEYDLIYVFLSNRVYPTRLNRKIYTENVRPAIHQAIYDAMPGE